MRLASDAQSVTASRNHGMQPAIAAKTKIDWTSDLRGKTVLSHERIKGCRVETANMLPTMEGMVASRTKNSIAR